MSYQLVIGKCLQVVSPFFPTFSAPVTFCLVTGPLFQAVLACEFIGTTPSVTTWVVAFGSQCALEFPIRASITIPGHDALA